MFSTLLYAVFYIVIVGLAFWMIWWFIGQCSIPEPFNKLVTVLVALAATIFVLSVLFSLLRRHPMLLP